MKFKFFFASDIKGLPDENNGQDIIDNYLKEITKNIKIDSIKDWTLIFTGLLSKSDKIAITKRGITYPKEKEKEITIIVPIPFKENILWGIDKKKFAPRPPLHSKYFKLLEIDYNDYSNLKDFITDSIKLGIKNALQDGITLQKEKIKIKK